MKQLQVLMPMAGLGSRFRSAGIATLKPLILVDEIPMFVKSLHSISIKEINYRYIFVIKKEDDCEFSFSQIINQYFPDGIIIILDEMTRGPAETCYKARSVVSLDDPLIILDCDLSFKCAKLNDYFNFEIAHRYAGAVVSFISQDPRYSYALVRNDEVIKTAEKEVISSFALAGAYAFSQAKFFFNAVDELLLEKDKFLQEKHFYIAPLYNRLISKNYKILHLTSDEYKSYGTPEELARVQK